MIPTKEDIAGIETIYTNLGLEPEAAIYRYAYLEAIEALRQARRMLRGQPLGLYTSASTGWEIEEEARLHIDAVLAKAPEPEPSALADKE